MAVLKTCGSGRRRALPAGSGSGSGRRRQAGGASGEASAPLRWGLHPVAPLPDRQLPRHLLHAAGRASHRLCSAPRRGTCAAAARAAPPHRSWVGEETRPEASSPICARSPTGEMRPAHSGWNRALVYGSSTNWGGVEGGVEGGRGRWRVGGCPTGGRGRRWGSGRRCGRSRHGGGEQRGWRGTPGRMLTHPPTASIEVGTPSHGPPPRRPHSQPCTRPRTLLPR